MGALTFIARLELRVLVGLGFAFVFSAGYREISPFSSESVMLLSTAAMVQVHGITESPPSQSHAH